PLTRAVASIRGSITTQGGSVLVAGARVTITSLRLEAVTDASGQFSWTAVPIQSAITPVEVKVNASGFEEWSLKDVLVRQDDTLILSIDLVKPTQGFITPIRYSPKTIQQVNSRATGQSSPQINPNQTIPQTIRVGITGDILCSTPLTSTYPVNSVDFKSYVKHVLPNEWLNTWGQESLRAGAVAVKMYAWYWVNHGGKWPGADVIDSTCDQVYNPAIEYASTDQAVEDTWNWILTRQDYIFQAYHKDTEDCDPPGCLNQTGSAALARRGYTWDEILAYYYPGSQLSQINPGINSYALQFNGIPGDGPLSNRVQFNLIDPRQPQNSLPINVGAADFTIEWWMKASAPLTQAEALRCGSNQSWKRGTILLDRSLAEAGPQYGVSLAGEKLAVGVTGPDGSSLTLCGTSQVADGQWHHIAFQRRQADGRLWLFVDGQLDAYAAGPPGDISFQTDSSKTGQFDPFLFLGGGKDDPGAPAHQFYAGLVDELRFSSVLRYPTRGDFQPPDSPFIPDQTTLGLYHFDDGIGSIVTDAAGSQSSPTNGQSFTSGRMRGLEWVATQLFYTFKVYIPSIIRTK
ncbi:MAG TPA: SpoIID/LytB domain-containing protein, partial [Anaerolineales bacterium]